MLRYLVAIAITFFGAPGLGHLFLGKFKKGFILLGLMAALVIGISITLLSSVDINSFPANADFSTQYKYISELMNKDTQEMFISDIVKAILYSFAVVDIVFDFLSQRNKEQK
jgi:TM2 domain-containing membrane protein YozV